MTANKLANWIENGSPFGDYETAKQASAMLRQQQAEIEALKLRELTDEEMLEVYKKLFNKKNEFKENLKRRSYFDFARAIIQKASE